MRISTNLLHQEAVNSLNSNYARLSRTQQQVATGKRIQKPSDDPQAAASVLNLNQSVSVNNQYIRNSSAAKDSVSLVESTLASVTKIMQDIRTQAVNAGNAALSARERSSLAADIRSRMQELLGLANTQDGGGQYLFSGFQTSTKPFSETTPGNVAYYGDQGQRFTQISTGRQIAISDNGNDIFQRIKNGNGTFVASAGGSNTGNGLITQGTVTNPSALTRDNYQITFTVTATGTTYSVVNTDTAASVITNAAYTNDGAISFDGIQVQVQDVPANGDTFNIAPSTDTSLFTMITGLATALDSTNTTVVKQGVGAALSNFTNGLDNILKIRATTGTRLNEIEATQDTGLDININYKTSISRLEDLDYNQAISDLTLQQILYEASQKSYVSVQQLSLFNFL